MRKPLLGWRLIYAAAFLAPLIGLLVLDYRFSGGSPGVWLLPFAAGLATAAAAELVGIFPEEYRPGSLAVPLGVGAIVLLSGAPLAWSLAGSVYPPDCPLGKLGWPLGAAALAVTIVLLCEMVRFRPGSSHVMRIALATFALVYIGLFLSFLYPLRAFGGNEIGLTALLSMLLIVKMSDVGAYTAGKLLGRVPLAPKLSPAKTVEGALGGVLTAAVVSWAFFAWLAPWIAPGANWADHSWRSLTYGLVLAAAAIVGDLAESLIKRDLQRKDSSRWLRGLGGILDLLDSVIIAAPTAYLCWAVGLVGVEK